MSETLVLGQIPMDATKSTANEDEESPMVAIDGGATTTVTIDDDEDLEDGEIDDDDDDDDDVKIVNVTNVDDSVIIVSSSFDERKHKSDLNDPPPPISAPKSKKPQPMEDDHASSIENALANVLKKKGIEVAAPKIDLRTGPQDVKDHKDNEPGQGTSRSSRRRKRKRQQEREKDRDKDRKEKRKRHDSNEPLPPPLDDADMDEMEMMNVRGGSPPPMALASLTAAINAYKDQFESGEDSYSSYDSYDSASEVGRAPEGNADGTNRRRRRNKKDSRKRRERRDRSRENERNATDNRQDKRTRRDSGDDKHRQEPRKLELCKFYLMECCAKREKCSYMHADFPCKYYYLGMECTAKEACKFAHGEPLSMQLRAILLKHLETAPKEIIGNFKRLARDVAITQMTQRHEELCQKFNIENNWTPTIAKKQQQQQQQQQLQQQQQQLQQQQSQQQQQMQQLNQSPQQSRIPSLLDIVIAPPLVLNSASPTSAAKAATDRQRKSRWADSSAAGGGAGTAGSGTGSSGPTGPNKTGSNTAAVAAATASISPPSNQAPSYLDLKNLTGILSRDHIDKLSQLGIVNLEQVNQLTFGQLNQIGLTIAEISDIQLNAMNMAKLGVTGPPAAGEAGATPAAGMADENATSGSPSETVDVDERVGESLTSRDVDMRFLPSVIPPAAATTAAGKDPAPQTDSNEETKSGIGNTFTVDYSSYLRDANYERQDTGEDEIDEEQLIIDDGNAENDENVAKKESPKVEPRKRDSFDSPIRLPKVQMPFANLGSNALKNPFTMPVQEEEPVEQPPPNAGKEASLADAFQAYYKATGEEDDESFDRKSNSCTPPYSGSSTGGGTTPEAEAEPEPDEEDEVYPPKYTRATFYDLTQQQIAEDEERRSRKADTDMRFTQTVGGTSGLSDIDLRLPFQPVTNYTPASEIDGSINSHLPMTYKVVVVDVPRPSYSELRLSFKADNTFDPRMRRILGMAELMPSGTAKALSRNVRKSSSTIASPDSGDASPKYYIPPVSGSAAAISSAPHADTEAKPSLPPPSANQRVDPRRARTAVGVTTGSVSGSSAPSASNPSTALAGAMKQNIEIRNLLQKSDWYKKLNSKVKIMVNQQLALISTELKKFHQDPSPNKIFDLSLIMNSTVLQQILTNLGIFIDEDGIVAHLESDDAGADGVGVMPGGGIALPNLSQPPPTGPSLDFLRGPPPNMAGRPQPFGPGGALGMGGPPPMNIAPFGQMRPSLLGMPPQALGNAFNPIAAGINPNFLAACGGAGGIAGIMPGGPMGFGNFGPGGMPPNMQRNFGSGGGNNNNNNNNNNNQRNQRHNRRNNNGKNKHQNKNNNNNNNNNSGNNSHKNNTGDDTKNTNNK